jgi:hypothetical protein
MLNYSLCASFLGPPPAPTKLVGFYTQIKNLCRESLHHSPYGFAPGRVRSASLSACSARHLNNRTLAAGRAM